MTSVEKAMAETRLRLAQLAVDRQAVDRAHDKIGAAAAARHGVVSSELDALRSAAVTNPAAADRYQELVAERGRLGIVTGAARRP